MPVLLPPLLALRALFATERGTGSGDGGAPRATTLLERIECHTQTQKKNGWKKKPPQSQSLRFVLREKKKGKKKIRESQ